MERERYWRLALLVLSLVAMAGPWGFDAVYVAGQPECTAAIRLGGDICGVPLSGFWFLAATVGMVFSLAFVLIQNPTIWVEWLREARFMGPGLLLFAGPLLSALVVIVHAGRPAWRALHFAAWAIGGALSLAMATNRFEQLVPGLWGLWLYFGLAAAALGLDVWSGYQRLRARAAAAP